MDYILEEIKTGTKVVITKEQKDLLDIIADIDYTPVDTKIYIINRSKYITSVIR